MCTTASSGKRDETDITITVEEKSWRSLHLGATTDGNEEAAVRTYLTIQSLTLFTINLLT